MKWMNRLLLDKEARLFDTKEFLIKTFVAVLLGSLVGGFVPYVAKDMISLLFGMILTIEPVNLTGVRSGLKQVEATVIGALITGLLLALFGSFGLGGYAPWVVALAVTATLYVSLVIDWRNFSVVAVFTAIYMTQYVQFDSNGQPSEIRTFMLRISALLTGVAIAFFVNWIFSVFGYRHMLEKRVYHIMDDLTGKMKRISLMTEQGDFQEAGDIMRSFPGTFNNVDWIYGTALDLEKDPSVKRGQLKQVKLEKIMKMTNLLREIGHITYDICYRISKGDHHYREEAFTENFKKSLHHMEMLMEKLDLIIHNQRASGEIALAAPHEEEEALAQIRENIIHMDELLKHYA